MHNIQYLNITYDYIIYTYMFVILSIYLLQVHDSRRSVIFLRKKLFFFFGKKWENIFHFPYIFYFVAAREYHIYMLLTIDILVSCSIYTIFLNFSIYYMYCHITKQR